MKRIRVAGIIPMENGYALMHRENVKNHPIGNYYTIPGGGLEEKETLEEGTIREIKEEFGIDVKIVKQLYYLENDVMDQYFFLCEYVSGEMGTGDGPEFSGDPKYKDKGTYTPEIIAKEAIKDIMLLPPIIKEKMVKDIEEGII